MTDKPKDGGSAFPLNTENTNTPGAFAPDPGMSLRDWFAGQALTGLIGTAAEPCMTGMCGVEDATAKTAYRLADAMLKAREQS